MSQDLVISTARPVAGAPRPGSLLSEVRSLWEGGTPPDALAVVRAHPGLEADKGLVLDLAYEEYCLRVEAGETLDLGAFCDRFPAYRNSLRRILDAHCFLEQHPYLLETPAWPEPGQTLLGFSLLAELGRGAFARVYLAAEPALGDRRVALKVSRRGSAEARTLGKLSHGNVVPVYSVQTDPHLGLTVVCMRYLGSATLCDVLDRAFSGPEPPVRGRVILEAARGFLPDEPVPGLGPPDALVRDGDYVDAVLHLGAQLAEGLAAVHAAGVCHRDLKPSNILLSPDGRPWLLDFNLSADEQVPGHPFGGTLPYMAPEQLRAYAGGTGDTAQVDARSDLFALGVILYELLAGRHPFGPLVPQTVPDQFCDQLLARQARGPAPLRLVNRRVSVAAARVITCCLAADPSARHASAAALAQALRDCLAQSPRPRRWAGLHPLVAAGATSFLLLAGTGIGLYPRSSVRPPVEPAPPDWSVEEPADAVVACFLRGRAELQQGRFEEALTAFRKADELAGERDGRTKACIGYCLIRLKRAEEAIAVLHQAIQRGCDGAAVYNNLGFSYTKINQLEEAHSSLDRALRLDPQCQAAYHNRALVAYYRARQTPSPKPAGAGAGRGAPAAARSPLDSQAFADMARAEQLGPESAQLHLHAAYVHAYACDPSSPGVARVLEHLRKAIALGEPPAALEQNPVFARFRNHPEFTALTQMPAQPPSPPAQLVVDPVSYLVP